MRLVTALAIVVVNIGMGGWVGINPALAEIKRFPISECYTVTISTPTAIKPAITVCQV